MSSVTRIETLIGPSLQDMGYDVVRLQLSGSERPQLQIMIDRLDEQPVTVDDYADVSRAVSAILDVEDPIAGAYTLEVSSPGIDRPLTRPRDYERFAGLEIKLELTLPIDGRKRFRGKLLGFVDDHVHMEIDHEGEQVEIALPFADIQIAKLVMSDALLRETATPSAAENEN